MKAFGKGLANALSFAHLAGIGRNAARADNDDKPERDHEDGDAKAEDDPKKQREGESDEDYAKRMEEDDDKKDKSASADNPDDDEDGKKEAKAGDGEDDNDEEMRGKSVAAAARRREQARCAAIFASSAAGRNPVLAANLAFKTRMSRSEALAVLEGTPAASVAGSGREARNPKVGAGTSVQANSKAAVAQSWDTAFAKANPRRK